MTLHPLAVPARWLTLLPCAMLLLPFCLPALAADLPEVVATVHDQPISVEELSASMRGQLLQMDMERYEAMKAQLDSLVAERLIALEAAERGMSVEEFERVEVFAKMEPVTPEQVRAFYDGNKERLSRPFEELEGRIMAHLQRQSEARRRAALGRELRQRYPVKIALAPPRADVGADDDPFMGPQDAPVTLVEFSDFQCPYCRSVQSVLKRLMTAYHGQLKLVFRDFPLRQIHPEAQKAAEAAQCANDQGQFWQYHDRLFAVTELGGEALKQYAVELGLDAEQFDTCLDSEKYSQEVQNDIDDAIAVGVNATPSFFVNGLPINGAVPFERFVEMVELALARANGQ
jgi:protein-disulfide isomerase